MATYAESLNILNDPYWQGGGEDNGLGAENYLTESGWSGDALSGNPWLSKYLPEITGAGAGWEGASGGANEGTFRNLQSYVPFEDRESGETLPGFAQEGTEFGSDVWKEEDRDFMGMTGALGALEGREAQMKSNLDSDPYAPFAMTGGRPDMLENSRAMEMMGYEGGGRENWEPIEPDKGNVGPYWDKLNWSLASVGEDNDFRSRMMGTPGTDIGQDYTSAFQGTSGGYGQTPGPQGNWGHWRPRFGGASNSSALNNPWYSNAGDSKGLFRGTSDAANTQYNDMDNSMSLPSEWTASGTNNPTQGYQNLSERVSSGLQGSSYAPFSQMQSWLGQNQSQSYLDRTTKSGQSYNSADDPYRHSFNTQTGGYTAPGGGFSYSMMPGITGPGSGNVLDTGGLNLSNTQAMPWQQMFGTKDIAEQPGMDYTIPLGYPHDKQKEALTYANQSSMTGPHRSGNLKEVMSGPFRSSFDMDDNKLNDNDFTNAAWLDSDTSVNNTMMSEAIQRNPDIQNMASSSTKDPFSSHLRSYIYNSSDKPAPYMSHKGEEQQAIADALGQDLRRNSEFGPAAKMAEISASASAEGVPLQSALGNLQTGELAAREEMLRGEVGGMQSFNKFREDIIGDRATGGLRKNIYDTQKTGHDDMMNEFDLFQGEGAPGTETEGLRTKQMRELFGYAGQPGSLGNSRQTGTPGTFGQRLEDLYQGYRGSLADILETKDSDELSGLGGVSSSYSMAGAAAGDTSSDEYQAREKFKNKWETEILPGYEGDVAGERSDYGTKLAGFDKTRKDDIKDVIKESRTDLRDVNAQLRDLDLKGTQSRREIRGFEGGGLRSGKRSRLGGEEYQRLMEERRQLLDERKGIKESKKVDIKRSREDARVDIDELTEQTKTDIFELQDDDTGVEGQIKDAARESAEDLTTAEQNLWGESEDIERDALDQVLNLEADATTPGSIKEDVAGLQATEEASYATKLQDAQTDITGGKSNLSSNLWSSGGNKSIAPDMAGKMFLDEDSYMDVAQGQGTQDLAAASSIGGQQYGSTAPTSLKNIAQGRQDYMNKVQNSASWSLQNLENKAKSTFSNVKAAGEGTGKYGSWANQLRDQMQKSAKGAIGDERGEWQKSLFSHYMDDGGDPLNPDKGDAKGWMPDMFGRGGGYGSGTKNLFGQTYYPAIIGDNKNKNEGGAIWGRRGSEPGGEFQNASGKNFWNERGMFGPWGKNNDWVESMDKPYFTWGSYDKSGWGGIKEKHLPSSRVYSSID